MTTKAKSTDRFPRKLRLIRRVLRGGRRDEGGSLVEMSLVCAFVYLPMLFGIFQVTYALYVYNFVCSTAHQATRYAAVRGSSSCLIQSTFVDCNLNPTGSTNPVSTAFTPLQNYVQSMGLMGINPNNLTVTATWYVESFNSGSGFSVGSWTQACGSASGRTEGTSSTCTITVNGTSATVNSNDTGNAVQVQVTYQFPLNIPFIGGRTLPIKGISQMMISE